MWHDRQFSQRNKISRIAVEMKFEGDKEGDWTKF